MKIIITLALNFTSSRYYDYIIQLQMYSLVVNNALSICVKNISIIEEYILRSLIISPYDYQ